MYYTLTADERIKFLNELIAMEIEKENEKSKEWMVQGCNLYRFYSRAFYGHDTDEKVHDYMDRYQKQVPKYVDKDLWEAYLNSEEENEYRY